MVIKKRNLCFPTPFECEVETEAQDYSLFLQRFASADPDFYQFNTMEL